MAKWRLWTLGDRGRLLPAGDDSGLRRLGTLGVGEYEHAADGTKLPRNHKPRSYRLTVGPWILAATTLQYRRLRNCLDVHEFVCRPEVTDDAQPLTREMLLFALTDSYRCSGLCRLRFLERNGSRSCPRGVPDAIVDLARQVGVELPEADAGWIEVEAGRRLYLALSGLSEQARQIADDLDRAGLVRTESIAYLIHNGAWSAAETESILRGCPVPELVLLGGLSPQDRHLAQIAMDHARSAILAGRLDRFLAARWDDTETTSRLLADDPRPIAVHVEAAGSVRRYRIPAETISLAAWERGSGPRALTPDRALAAVVLARRPEELVRQWEADLRAASALRGDDPAAWVLLVPGDFDWLSADQQARLTESAFQAGFGILAAAETFAQLSLEARRRLNFARIIRQ